jgi:protease IV
VKKRTAWVLAAGVAAIALGAAFMGALALALRGGGGARPLATWGSAAYLSLSLAGDVAEEPTSEVDTLFGTPRPTLRGLVESLDRAATDPKMKGVVVRVGSLTGGWGKVQELRDAIARFRKSGKPAYAHLESVGNQEYYLATACSKIFAVPQALVLVHGLAAEVTFFRQTLDKLGVEAQFEGVGRYKNAPNQFTEDHFTPPHREQTEALLDSLHSQYVSAIAESRKKTREDVRALLDAGPYDAAGALKAGLVDELVYEDELESRLNARERVTPGRYVRSARGFGFDGRPRVALVYAVGEIMSGESETSPFGGDLAGSSTLARAIRQARNDATIKAIVLRVDSPGGSGTASEVIWRELTLARKSKPVIVSMGDVAASGGYYIAMPGDAIVAQPATITGSIGVFSGKFTLRGLYDKLGLKKEIVERGRNGAFFSEYRPWTDEERERMRDLMVSFYGEFVSKAAKGRGKSYEDIDRVAQGRVWTGEEAFKVGLVDRLGGLETALALAREKAKLGKDEELSLVVLPEKKGVFETILERQEESAGGEVRLLPADVRAFLRWATVLGGKEPIARLPFELRVF